MYVFKYTVYVNLKRVVVKLRDDHFMDNKVHQLSNFDVKWSLNCICIITND